MNHNERDVEKVYENADMASKLRRLADALETGTRFRISVAGHRVNVPGDAQFSIEHERDAEHEELEFQFTWTRAAGDDPEEDDEDDEDDGGSS